MLQVFKTAPLLTPLAKRIFHITVFITLVVLGEASLAYFVPNHIMNTFNNSALMGLIIATSSMVGLIADLTIPQLLPKLSVKRALSFTVFFQIMFAASLAVTMFIPSIPVFILAMGFWGIYFEFLSFTGKIFVATKVPRSHHSVAWANILFGRSLSYITGPIIISILLLGGEWPVLRAILGLVFGIQVLLLFLPPKTTPTEEIIEQPKEPPQIKKELGYWKTLLKTAWPAVSLVFLFGLLDASFWTIGAVLSEKLYATFELAYLIIPAYIFPAMLSNLALMKLAITSYKEKLGALFLILGASSAVIFGLQEPGPTLLLFSFGIGFFNSLAFNLAEATFSDLAERIGVHKQHMIGLSSSIYSLAFVIGPILAGALAFKFHEQLAFSIIGGIGMGISLLVLLLTPKRLLLPQKEIQKWKD